MKVNLVFASAALAFGPLLAGLAMTAGHATAVEPHRLVGFGCGAERVTMTATEEDHFPSCDQIETPRSLCGHDDAKACADYLGREGW